MTISPAAKLLSSLCVTALLAACSSFDPPELPLFGSSDTTPVVTEYTQSLQCLGALISDGDMKSILIEVDDIRDRTVPERLSRPSRLSQAGEWLVVTAISKLETPLVRSTLSGDAKHSSAKPTFKLSGAWTQDDELLKQSGGLLDFAWLTGAFSFGGDRRFDYVAGDFASMRDGVVDYSTAIGVLVASNGVDAQLLVEDGVNQASIGFQANWADGPQMAQRRIAEAATLIHVARHYKIDFRPCLESGWADADGFRRSMQGYSEMQEQERQQVVERDLTELGYDPGPVDGRWDSKATRALTAYQVDRGLPPSGKISSAVFALIRSDIAKRNR